MPKVDRVHSWNQSCKRLSTRLNKRQLSRICTVLDNIYYNPIIWFLTVQYCYVYRTVFPQYNRVIYLRQSRKRFQNIVKFGFKFWWENLLSNKLFTNFFNVLNRLTKNIFRSSLALMLKTSFNSINLLKLIF